MNAAGVGACGNRGLRTGWRGGGVFFWGGVWRWIMGAGGANLRSRAATAHTNKGACFDQMKICRLHLHCISPHLQTACVGVCVLCCSRTTPVASWWHSECAWSSYISDFFISIFYFCNISCCSRSDFFDHHIIPVVLFGPTVGSCNGSWSDFCAHWLHTLLLYMYISSKNAYIWKPFQALFICSMS